MTGIGISGTGKRYEWTATRRPKSLAGLWPLIPSRAGDATHRIAFSEQNDVAARAIAADAAPLASKPSPTTDHP
jgi:hypothetical protein